MPTTMQTERLLIRNFTVDDWEALHEMIVQYQASEFAAYDHQWPTSADEIKGIAAWFAGGDSFLAVCLKDIGRFIGFVSLNREEKEGTREYNLGYVFNFDYHGRGYATEACRAVVSHAFDRLQADAVVTGTAAANLPSCRLLERLGLRRTGESRASFRNGTDGKPIEFTGYTFAITRDEWHAGRAQGAVCYPPPESAGGWRTSGIQAGVDLGRLEAARQWNARHGVPSAVAIVRHGSLVAEWYEQGADAGTSFNVYSCSKSYTSTAYGVLFDDVRRGRFAGSPVEVDSPVYAFLPEGRPLTDPRKERITFRHLLTMTSGIPGESIGISGTRTAPGVSPFTAALGRAPFAAKGAQSQAWVDRLTAEPGAFWDYSDPAYIHLGLAFHHITGEELYEFVQRRVLAPIDVDGLTWDMIGLDDGSTGRHTGAHGGVHTTARDMARFGYLMLRGGTWSGTPIVPSWWLELTSRTSQPHNPQYGLGWWVNTEGTWPGVPRDTFAAMGWNCNACYVIPSLDLVAVRIGTGPAGALDTDPAFIQAVLAGVVEE